MLLVSSNILLILKVTYFRYILYNANCFMTVGAREINIFNTCSYTYKWVFFYINKTTERWAAFLFCQLHKPPRTNTKTAKIQMLVNTKLKFHYNVFSTALYSLTEWQFPNMSHLCLFGFCDSYAMKYFNCDCDKVVTDLHRILGLETKYCSEFSSSINYTSWSEMRKWERTYPTPEL
jgi:hypothetical protein